jgi:hypothetical protein
MEPLDLACMKMRTTRTLKVPRNQDFKTACVSGNDQGQRLIGESNSMNLIPWKFDSPLPQPPQAFPKGIHLLMKYFQLVALHHTETPIAPASCKFKIGINTLHNFHIYTPFNENCFHIGY